MLGGKRDRTTAQVVEIKEKMSGPASSQNERIPESVWAVLQGAGAEAAERLRDMLEPSAFERLKHRDQLSLLGMALDRAYGRPDPGIKRSVEVSLSGEGNDAVAASLARLATSVTLPEYADKARDVTPPEKQQKTQEMPVEQFDDPE